MSQFWSSSQSDPKRNYRFWVKFGELPFWAVTTCTLPSYKIGEAKHVYLNHTFKYPGKIEWQNITVGLRDPGSPDTTEEIRKMLIASGYFYPSVAISANTNSKNFATVSKKQAINAIGGDIVIKQVDGEGKTITTWNLINAWVMSFASGELKYDSDDLIEIKLEVVYDWATSTQF